MKKLSLSFLSLLIIMVLFACSTGRDSDKPLVITTLFPQYDITRALAGDYVDLEFLLTPGTDAHTFEPSPRRVVQILEADLLIYTGDTMEPWVSRLIAPAKDEGLNILDLSRNVALINTDHQHNHDDHHDDHDHHHGEEDEIGEFTLLNRRNDNEEVAYVHGNHWHGSLPGIDVGGSISIGAYIVSADDRERELDAEGEINGLKVSLHEGAEAGIVDFAQHGDHVHVIGVKEGITQIVFHWTHRGEIRYTTPPIQVVVGDYEHDDHDHHHGEEDEIGEFTLLNRRNNNEEVAYVHGNHWHGSLPGIDVGGSISIGANIVSADDRERELDSEGEINGLTVSLHEGAEAGIVDFAQHGDHVNVIGIKEGITQIVFHWTHRGEIRFTTPPIQVVVGDSDHQHGLLDPHIWTDPINLAIMTLDIRNALIELLPEHEESIRKNADAYLSEIDEIHADFLDLVQNSALDIVMYGGHNAMGYFMARYNLRYVNPYRGFSTDAAPTPQALAEMINTMKEYNISYLFSEKLISPHVANAIAEETNATILYIYAMENAPRDEFETGITLFNMFRHNLEMFRIGLNYQE